MDKPIDCIEMKRQGQEAVRKRLRGMTKEQQLAYWARRYEEMAAKQQEAKQKRRSA